MNSFRADLHCHSNCSDGTLSPEELIDLAVSIGLSGLSITDHDSIDAYASAIPLSKSAGIEIIPGAEFSSMHKGVSIHILAYAFDLNSEALKQFCILHNRRRENRNREILERLAKHGMRVTEEELNGTHPNARRTIGRPHIAQIMIQKGYVGTVVEAFNKYLGEGRICYAPGESFSVEETLEYIKAAQGLSVIAHPHLILNGKTLHDLLEMPFDGIECFYSKFDSAQNQRWIKIAQNKGLLMTGGSDFHGDIKPAIPLGCSWVGEEVFRLLQQHYTNL